MNQPDRNERLSVFFPVYNDENTVRLMTEKAIEVCKSLASEFEVIIVDDGGPDRSGEIADDLASEYSCVHVIHHEENQGYGAAIRSGLAACQYEWICFTDGDNEYDLWDLQKLWRLRRYYALIITFRYVRQYSGYRIFVSKIYNFILRRLFDTSYRDISTGLRLVRKEVVDDLRLDSSSPFIGAEVAIKSMLKGYPVGELGIQTYPREFGTGASTTLPNIIKTIKDMLRCYREIFSPTYDIDASSE